MYKIWNLIIILVSLIAISGTTTLVIDEFNKGHICPKIITIPACYIVLFCFSLGLLSQLVSYKYSVIVFSISIGVLTFLALPGTLFELFGHSVCPRTSNGIPMCYISLAFCTILIISKFQYQKEIKYQ